MLTFLELPFCDLEWEVEWLSGSLLMICPMRAALLGVFFFEEGVRVGMRWEEWECSLGVGVALSMQAERRVIREHGFSLRVEVGTILEVGLVYFLGGMFC